MDTEALLIGFFERTLNKYYPELETGEITNLLEEHLKTKKYDKQDEALIGIVLKDKENPLEESFIENLNRHIENIEGNPDPIDFLESSEGRNEIPQLYLSSLERLIDYYYNLLFNSQFFTG